MAVEAGTRVGRFVIHEYVGQGDLGLLFRARGPNSSSVAVKVLRSLSGAKVRARFLVLARRLGGIRHPNLASVLDFGEHDDAPYLVLQFVPGGSLADLLRSSSISQPAALWVLRGIAAGIDHAHQSGLVHGALKPQQIVLDGHDHPLVTDFGLAPLRWPRPDGVTVVVPERNGAYAAPELVTGGQPTAAADRYAFATIAYELLTGSTPFQGEPHDVMNAQLDATPPAPSLLNPALTPELGRVLLRGLAKDPRARWQTCTEMVDALAEAMSPGGPTPGATAGASVAARPARPTTATRPMVVTRPAPGGDSARAGGAPPAAQGLLARWSLVLAGALIAIVLAVGGTVAWLSAQPPVVAIVLSTTRAHVGDSLVITASNLPANQAGMIDLHSDPEQIGTFRADGHGNLRVEVVVPQDAAIGDHLVTLCWEDGCHGGARVTIVDAGTPTATATPAAQDGPAAAPAPAVAVSPAAARIDTGSQVGLGPAPVAAAPTAGSPTGQPAPPSGPTPTPNPTARPTPTPAPSRTPSPSPSASPSPTPYPSASPSPSPSMSPAVSPSP
jgi:eukaryotic-like serine/threonine-protein kinase